MAQSPSRSQQPRPAPLSGEFVAPAGPPRARGEAPARPVVPPARTAPEPETRGSRSGPARSELTLCGLPAVQARFQRDAGSIQRLFFDYATGRKIGVMCKVLAQARKVYRCVEPAELEKIAGTVHHGGVVAVVRAEAPRAPTPAEIAGWARRREPVLVLDRIGNAHNLGAIARTAAFLGVALLVVADDPAAAKPNDAAYRVSEGGLEQLEVRMVKDVAAFLGELAAAGYEVVGAATRGGRLGTGAPASKPLALVLGNEEQGVAPAVEQACTRLVTIPGSGKVESLNVSVAAALLMWELMAAGKRPAAASR